MYRKTRGFTLLEIMIGVFIISSMAIMFFYVVRSSSKESTFSSNYFSAIMIGQKVAEDIIGEYSINPYAEESLGLNTSLAKKTGIIDGDSVFFMALEDRRPPWGEIESAKDGGINELQEPLYSQMKGFLLGSSAVSDSPTYFSEEKSNLQKVNLVIEWKNAIDAGKTEKTFFVFAPRNAKKVSGPLADIDYSALGLEDAVKSLLPEGTDPTKSVSEILGTLNANEKLIFDLAATQILCKTLATSDVLKKLIIEVQECEKKLGLDADKKTEFELRRQIAKNWYKIAKLSFNIIAAVAKTMAPVAEDARANEAFGKLNQSQLKLSLKNIKITYRYFLDSMIAARFHYEKLLTPEMTRITGQKLQQDIIVRLFDIHRILALAPDHAKGQSDYTNFISRVKEMAAWRNQYLYRFADQESKLSEDIPSLMDKFPNLKPVHQILAKQIPTVLSFVESQN